MMRGSYQQHKPLSESDRIKQLLIRVGDEGPKFYKRDISKLYTNLLPFFQKGDQTANENALNLFVDCIAELTQKTSIYATIISLLSTKDSPIPEQVIDRLIEKLKTSLSKGNAHALRSTLIFLGELTNMGLFNTFIYINILFDFFHEADQSFEVAGDFFLLIGIQILPYVIDHLKEKREIELKSLLSNIQTLMSRRDNSYLKVLKVNKEQQGLNSRIDILWNEIKQYIETGKKADLLVVVRPYDEFKEDLASIKEIKKNIKIPFGSKNDKLCISQSPPYYSFFDSETLKKEAHSSLNLIILQDHIVDILTTFYKSRKLAAQFLLKLAENHSCFRLVIEGVFNEMFNLPNSNSKLVFYTGVLISVINELPLSNKEPATQAIHEVINQIFRKCETYDLEVLERFSDFFAHFLSNFDFKWDWSQWKYVADLDISSIEVALLKKIIVRLVQISVHDRIKDILPDDLKDFLPPAEFTDFEYDRPDSTNAGDVKILRDKFNSKPEIDEMNKFLVSGESNLESTNEQLLDIFLQTMLHRASKSLAHLTAHFEKYHSTIKLLNKGLDASTVLNATRKVFKNSNFHIHLTINHLQKFGIVNYKNIVEWVCKAIETEEEAPNNFNVSWEILLATLAKITNDVEVLRWEIKQAEANKEDIDDAVKKLEALEQETQDVFGLVLEKLHNLVVEIFETNPSHQQAAINLLIQIARKYRREFDGLLSKIEMDFQGFDNDELKEKLLSIKKLRFKEI